MANPEYVGLQVGGLVTPLTSSTANPLIQDADPALWTVLAFYQSVIQTHLGARWDSEFTRAGLPKYVGQAVQRVYPFDPTDFFQSAQLLPPFLAVFVPEEEPGERTRNWWHLVETWKVLWVLPPLAVDQFFGLSPLLRAAAKVLTDRTEQGHDPAFQNDAQICEVGNIEQIGVKRVRYGSLRGVETSLFFPTLELELEVHERKMPTPGLSLLTGVDDTIQSAGSGSAVDVTQSKQDF